LDVVVDFAISVSGMISLEPTISNNTFFGTWNFVVVQ
jgi:hypothetical protein